MKGPSCAFVASVVAASTAALSSSADPNDRNAAFHAHSCRNDRFDSSSLQSKSSGGGTDQSDGEKFAPRFDGLRFIETLVTAHR